MLAEGNPVSEHLRPVVPLAAMGESAENSRQGFTTKEISSYPGSSEVKFKSEAGIEVSLRPEGIWSRCQSLNRYAYALNNPTTNTDPSGLQPDDCEFDLLDCGGSGCDPDFDQGCAGLCEGIFSCLPQPFPPPPAPGCGRFICYLPPPTGPTSQPTGNGGGESLPPAASNPNGPWQMSGPFGQSPPWCDLDSCVLAANPLTGQVGVSGNLTLPWWGLTGTFYFGIAVDLHGHIGVYYGGGFGVGRGEGASGSAGVQGGLSDADTICGLRGPFGNGSGTFGVEGVGGTVDVFQGSGNGPGGTVTGGTITLGVAGGASASAAGTYTDVVPINGGSCP
jgi:hypothetical protein